MKPVFLKQWQSANPSSADRETMADQLKLQRKQYPGAERNRRAKMKFLSEMKSYYENKRKVSIESLQSEGGNPQQVDTVPKVDLSVPGTPVCSRYLERLSRLQSESENVEKEPVKLPNEIVISSMIIDKFIKDMKSLNADEVEQHAELVQINDSESENGRSEQQAELVYIDETDTDSGIKEDDNDLTSKYFKESEEKQAYKRTFSEVVQTLHHGAVRSPVVKRYFEESSSKHSYSRGFDEAFKELNPDKLQPDPLLIDSDAITKGYKTSVPGTPISSTNLRKLKKHNYISESSDEEEDTVETKPSILTNPLDEFIKEMEQLKLMKDSAVVEKKPRDNFSVDAYLSSSEAQKTYARTFSQAVQTLASSEVKSPTVKNYFDQSEQKKTFRRDFSEVYQEINKLASENKTVDSPVVNSTTNETIQFKQKKIDDVEVKRNDSLEELLGTFQPPKLESKPVENDFCVTSYMNSSDARKTYARTLSEAAQALQSSDVKSPTVRNYFDQSTAKKSFSRGFSEAYQQAADGSTIPTPDNTDDEPKENLISGSSGEDKSTNEPLKQTARSLSVPGTPVNSRKLVPTRKKVSRPPAEPKNPENNNPPAQAPARARTMSATEHNRDEEAEEFWKKFGATAV
ncbi:muscle M-line assembly protein unc-89-like isoform X2 [Wyeomyia smithii]|uniref:muscle M-line assembly protein unc-89-like isoform X2 n=1 Tax=Wyeomyia smithii TaxID=174621 RepID=UPI002467C2EB|nr:muscle M-line assembly protein unc-89-like isoform X2 [Wyeomyia smithii]